MVSVAASPDEGQMLWSAHTGPASRRRTPSEEVPWAERMMWGVVSAEAAATAERRRAQRRMAEARMMIGGRKAGRDENGEGKAFELDRVGSAAAQQEQEEEEGGRGGETIIKQSAFPCESSIKTQLKQPNTSEEAKTKKNNRSRRTSRKKVFHGKIFFCVCVCVFTRKRTFGEKESRRRRTQGRCGGDSASSSEHVLNTRGSKTHTHTQTQTQTDRTEN